MKVNTEISLNATEIAGLWTFYVDDALEVCIIKYYLNKVKDDDIKAVLQHHLFQTDL